MDPTILTRGDAAISSGSGDRGELVAVLALDVTFADDCLSADLRGAAEDVGFGVTLVEPVGADMPNESSSFLLR
jgi:hypothetical protein